MLSTDGATHVAGMFDHQMAQCTWQVFGHSIMVGCMNTFGSRCGVSVSQRAIFRF